MSLVLKSNSKFKGSDWLKGLKEYKNRVIADGGLIKNESSLTSAFFMLNAMGINSNKIISAVSPNWGVKMSGSNITKMYSLFDASGDFSVKKGSYPLVFDDITNSYAFYSRSSYQDRMAMEGSFSNGLLSMFVGYRNTSTSGIPASSVVVNIYGTASTGSSQVEQREVMGYSRDTGSSKLLSLAGVGDLNIEQGVATGEHTFGFSRFDDGTQLAFFGNRKFAMPLNNYDVSRELAVDLAFARNASTGTGGALGNYHGLVIAKNLTKPQSEVMSNIVASSF